MEERIIEICKICGHEKVKALNKVREEFGLSLVDAKALVDKAYKKLSNDHPETEPVGLFAKRKENKEQARMKSQIYKEKHLNETRFDLSLTAGMQHINNISYPTMWARQDGLVYFEEDESKVYKITGFSWNGPNYTTVTQSHTEGCEKGKTKRKGRFIGAAVGTILLPGVGTVIGAAHGTGNKKSKKNSLSDTITTEHQNEIISYGTVKLRNINNDNIISISVACLSSLANRLSVLVCEDNENQQASQSKEQTYDSYEEIKKLKELLDMGILTQEEFDTKKKKLLGL